MIMSAYTSINKHQATDTAEKDLASLLSQDYVSFQFHDFGFSMQPSAAGQPRSLATSFLSRP